MKDEQFAAVAHRAYRFLKANNLREQRALAIARNERETETTMRAALELSSALGRLNGFTADELAELDAKAELCSPCWYDEATIDCCPDEDEDAAFVIAATPTVVRRLIARIRELESQ